MRFTTHYVVHAIFAKGAVVLHAETRFGEDVILDAAGAAPVNANLLYPGLENATAITGLQLVQPANSGNDTAVVLGRRGKIDI